MAEEEKQEETSKVVEKKSGNKMMIIVIIVLILLVLIIGGLAAFALLGGDDSVQNAQQAQNAKTVKAKGSGGRSTNLHQIGPMYPMDQFVVNLLSDSGNKFLKTSLDIELDSESLSAEMDKKKPAIRDIIIRTLSSKTFDEVSTMKGKERLKDEIVEKINEILVDGQVKNIFFTDFVVQ